MPFSLSSPAFEHNTRVPKTYTGEGKDTSPPLEWSAPPPETRSFAIICEDPDAPRGTWDHWLIWNIPPDTRKLTEGVAKTDTVTLLEDACQGKNSWPQIGYNGPMPPPGHGTHHYHFTIYAVDHMLDLRPGATKKELRDALADHILAQATLTGTYSR